MRIFISGQKHFGAEVLRLCLKKSHTITGVCCPIDDKHLLPLAQINNIPVIPAGLLNGDTFPDNTDLGITAHSFDYVGKRTRYKAKLGWIGYHPSILPRHRGRSSIEWTLRMKDPFTGGTVYWLNSGIDRGDIAYQKWFLINPQAFAGSPKVEAQKLWRDSLQDIGIELIEKAITDIEAGIIIKVKQDERVSTWEPSTNVNDIYRPDALLLEMGTESNQKATNSGQKKLLDFPQEEDKT